MTVDVAFGAAIDSAAVRLDPALHLELDPKLDPKPGPKLDPKPERKLGAAHAPAGSRASSPRGHAFPPVRSQLARSQAEPAVPKTAAAFDSASLAAARAVPDSIEQRIRRGFFADASWMSHRYGVTIDDLLAHLGAARKGAGAHVVRQVRHIADLAIAVGCAKGSSRAWADAAEWFEPVLVRGCRLRLDAIDAVVFARRFLAEVQVQTLEGVQRRAGGASVGLRRASLQEYLGNRPLRAWLADRLLGRLEHMTIHDDRAIGCRGSRTGGVRFAGPPTLRLAD
jgi:hypothetical protein